MRRHEKWMKMAAVYVSCGRQDKVLEMMQKIEDDDDDPQRADSESAGYHTPVNVATGGDNNDHVDDLADSYSNDGNDFDKILHS
jgi:hypothetical protein